MRATFRTFLISLLLIFLAGNLPAVAAPWPEYQSVYVNDFANALDDETSAELTEYLSGVRDELGVEMTVVTIRSVDDFDPASSWEEFATRLFNGWGIGDPERNDGVLFLFAMEDRNMRLEVGSGYVSDWDRTAQEIIDSIMVPNFKKGNINGGVRAGVRTMIARIRTNVAEGRAPTDTPYGKEIVSHTADGATITGKLYQDPEQDGWLDWLWYQLYRDREDSSWLDWLWYSLIVPVLGGGAWLIRRVIRTRPRNCMKCNTRMQLLSEMADDAYLDEGARVEETINSVDYDVWECPSCSHVHTERWRNWFSRYGACRACNYRALESDSRVLSPATTSSSGLKEITYTCAHCSETWVETKTIPRRSSSSSSSSSSFSGGSSSGGGGSGSW